MSIYDIDVTTINGKSQSMGVYRGKTLLIVNVASKCGFTSQYKGLQAIHQSHQAKGFMVLGFPCDQFGHQEPAAEEEIESFCLSTYNVTFPLFAKIRVNGEYAHPLFKYLKSQKRGILGTKFIKWNFTKFLVDKSGSVLKRYSPRDTPEKIAGDLVLLLG